MRLKHLQAELEGVKTWEQPKVHFEQYPTAPDIAAQMLLSALEAGDIEGALLADLGCGGGILGIGGALLGAHQVLACDIDEDALAIAADNVEEYEVPVDLLQCDVLQLADAGAMAGRFDCVVMNPPFGTQRDSNGIDLAFLRAGLALCSQAGAVYSLHKSSTRSFLSKTLTSWGASPQVVAQLRFDIPRMYRHHTKDSVDVAVDFWRVTKGTAMAALFPSEPAAGSRPQSTSGECARNYPSANSRMQEYGRRSNQRVGGRTRTQGKRH